MTKQLGAIDEEMLKCMSTPQTWEDIGVALLKFVAIPLIKLMKSFITDIVVDIQEHCFYCEASENIFINPDYNCNWASIAMICTACRYTSGWLLAMCIIL